MRSQETWYDKYRQGENFKNNHNQRGWRLERVRSFISEETAVKLFHFISLGCIIVSLYIEKGSYIEYLFGRSHGKCVIKMIQRESFC